MRTVLLALAVAGVMATVWYYAGTATRDNQVAERANGVSATEVVVAWVYSGGFVTETRVTWTPRDAASYNVTVTAGGNTGTFTTATTKANFTRTDSVVLPPTDPNAISTATVVIEPVGPAP